MQLKIKINFLFNKFYCFCDISQIFKQLLFMHLFDNLILVLNLSLKNYDSYYLPTYKTIDEL